MPGNFSLSDFSCRFGVLLSIGLPSMIVHVDMDAYYASIEIRDNPELRNQPVVVGGSPQGRGVVSAASYEARKYGIHSAMPASQVLRRCPQAIFLRPRMDYYASISKRIREIFEEYTSLVEPISLDEAFLDVSGSERLFGDAVSIAKEIKKRIAAELELVASAGVAPNKYLAKVASDLEKPDGLVVVRPEEVLSFLDPLPVKRIWGVGGKCEAKFNSIGIRTIGQIRSLSVEQLKPKFGINAQHFWNLSRGIDSRSVVPDRIAKSISHESTFPVDITDREILEAWIIELSGQVGRRLRRYDIKGRTIQLKLRFSDFRTITRSQSMKEPTSITGEIVETATQLIQKELGENHAPIRLIGVGVSKLRTGELSQRLLFDENEMQKNRNLDQVADEIANKFGSDAMKSGKVFEKKIRPRRFIDE